MKNLGYLECQKGGYHSGQFLNIVCLQPACKSNTLCCCACVEQSHQTHKTKTLKKLLIEADTLSKNYKQPVNKKQNVKKRNCNTDIMANMIENDQKHILSKFYEIKTKFTQQIDKLQKNVLTYYKSLYTEINKPQQPAKDLKSQLLQNIQLVQGSSNNQSLHTNVLKLLKSTQIAQKISGQSNQFETPDQESYLNFLKNSNNEINDLIQKQIFELSNKLKGQNQKLHKTVSKINNLWDNQLYKFSNIMHHPKIDVLNPFLVRANVDSVYQVAAMNPSLKFVNQTESFRFRINVNDLQWVGVGVCYKKIVQKNNYEFQFGSLGHGCYMVSGNAGSWSHSEADFNNVVKGFNFKQGDSVICTVLKNKICFIKEIPAEHEFSQEYSQKQYFQLAIKPEENDQLHPCVVCFYKNTEVEYLPSFSSQLRSEDLPVFKYKFSSKWKHHNSIILNETHLYGCQPTQYKCCILDSPIEGNGPKNEIKSITFRISRSTGGWIGLGLCHKNILVERNYDFDFELPGHGCYMISANGGSWSHIDSQANNLVRTFKLVEGDLVTVSLDQQNKKIYFKRGLDKYELDYNPVSDDVLYPIVVLYYPDDQIQILPEF